PPSFPIVPTQFVVPGQTLTISARASDPDIPPQRLFYSIVSAPPVSLLNLSGSYRWIVPTNQPVGDNFVTLRFTDDGTPPRSDVTTFNVVVQAPAATVIGSGPVI